jgi:uncharacterized repeat protein (TIGR03803 family)
MNQNSVSFAVFGAVRGWFLISGLVVIQMAQVALGQVVYERLKSFGFMTQSGGRPVAKLLEGSDGVLYGTTAGGGNSGVGTVFKVNKNGTGYTVLWSFSNFDDGAGPVAGLVQGIDGALYGTTASGGSSSVGTVFKLNTDGTGYTVLKSFAGGPGDGANPEARLVQGSDGMLYGTTASGGSSSAGTVFKLNTDGTGYTVLKSFAGGPGDGNIPRAELVQGSDGALYGTTFAGGPRIYWGTVFKLNTDGTGYTILHNFGNLDFDDGRPLGGLIQGTDGALYGTTQQGGTSGLGTVFKINTDGTGYTTLRSFSNSGGDGVLPDAGLVQGSDGALYGTTDQGGSNHRGTVFKLNPDGTGYAVLRSFSDSPAAGLVQGSDGALYGTTPVGGSSDSGTVFKLNTDGTGYTVLRSFSVSGGDGLDAFGAVQGSDGALYGVTLGGGTSGGGTVFKVNTDGTGYALLQTFLGGQNGARPNPVVQGNDGALYGTTEIGGSSGSGTVFKINTDGSGFTVLLAFSSIPGDIAAYPVGRLVQGTDGTLYGTTQQGGNNGSGTVFKISPDGQNYQVLYSFAYAAWPAAGLTIGPDGALYGTTWLGGDWSYGSVFKLSPDGQNFQTLYSFNGNNEGYPQATVVFGANGLLYGATGSDDGTEMDPSGNSLSFVGYGTVFSLSPDGQSYQVLHNFGGSDGAYPRAGLAIGADGLLYGTTFRGGSSSRGTVFNISPNGQTFNSLHSFSGTDGANPAASLAVGKNGSLYGTTSKGGDMGLGTVFSIEVLNTITGANVTVNPVDPETGGTPISLTFPNITQPGTTTITSSSTGAPPPSGFNLGQTPIYYDISTSAQFSGPVNVCISYPAGAFSNPNNARLFHYQNGAWVDVTTSVDTANNLICGTVTSFSPFAIFEPNQPPVITGLSGPTAPLGLATAAVMSVNFTDANAGDNETVQFTWGDGTSESIATGVSAGSLSRSHAYADAGVYSVTIQVSDGWGGTTSTTFNYVVVYDPTAGFVTGGGWIMSPPGAFPADASLTGKATFGFVSKYQKGANVPTGETQFQFALAGFNFQSTAYQWLVVAGAKAQYKGTGTVSGTSGYTFLLTGTDGQVNGGGGVDRFRIHIWNTATGATVYDNVAGAPDDLNNAKPGAISGGSIVIHQ